MIELNYTMKKKQTKASLLSKALLLSSVLLCQPAMVKAAEQPSELRLDAVQQTATHKIKVLIARDLSSTTVDVRGKYRLYDPYTGSLISHRHLGKKQLMQAKPEGLKWGEEFPDLYQLKIVPDDYREVIAVDGMAYRGTLYIYQIGEKLALVNELPIEDFLDSTLSSLYSDDTPHELLAAVAIAARSRAYYKQSHARSSYWDVDAQKEGYKGVVAADKGLAIKQAIRLTRHMLLSSTGPYEGVLTPIEASFGQESNAAINLKQASELASKGFNAAQILKRAFPSGTIELFSCMEP